MDLDIFHAALLSSCFDLLQVSIGRKDSRLVVELFKLLSLISNVFLILPPFFVFFFFLKNPQASSNLATPIFNSPPISSKLKEGAAMVEILMVEKQGSSNRK